MNKIFNKTLIKKEFKLQQPVFYGGFVYFFMILSYYTLQKVAEFNHILITSGTMPYEYEMYNFYQINGQFLPLMGAFAIYLGLAFAGEKQKKTMEEMARMPFSRKEIYFSKVIVSLFVLAMPLILNLGLFFLIGSTRPGFNIFVDKNAYIMAGLNVILISYFLYFFYLFVSMLFGSVVGALVCSSIFISFPLTLAMLIISNININQGYFDWMSGSFLYKASYFTPAYYISTGNVFDGVLWVVIGLILVFMLLGYHMFTIYKMERNSEFLTYTWTEKYFKIGVFICSVLAGRLFFHAILIGVATPFINQLIGMVIGGFLGYIIPKKIIDKARVA